eukprot:43246-Eustigmatos_ZCMA.PRE.1
MQSGPPVWTLLPISAHKNLRHGNYPCPPPSTLKPDPRDMSTKTTQSSGGPARARCSESD